MAPGKILVKGFHRARFLGPFGGILRHADVDVVYLPLLGRSHVAEERRALDQDNPVFTKEPIRAAIIHKRREEKIVCVAIESLQVICQGLPIFNLLQIFAAMGTDRAGENRKRRARQESAEGNFADGQTTEIWQRNATDSRSTEGSTLCEQGSNAVPGKTFDFRRGVKHGAGPIRKNLSEPF